VGVTSDTDPTVVDGQARSRATATSEEEGDATRIDTPRTLTPLEHSTVSLPKPETVMRRAEIEQSRRLAISGLIFNTVGLVVVPFFGGDPTARTMFIVGLAVAQLNNALLLYAASNEDRYRQRSVLLYFVVAAISNVPIIYYLGVFGPILVMFVLNLYTSCLGYHRRVAEVTLIGSTAPVAVLGGLMSAGLLDDPGMVSVTEHIGAGGRIVVVSCFCLFMVLTYLQARRTRDVMVASLLERDEAVRLASHREALFLEARHDLERALHAGGFGRFTDQTLGSYKLGAVLGRGGMGEVYEATHTETGEPAAVKMLLPEVLSRHDYVRRFLREVRIAASLDSPHVVRVLEVGDESAPLPYLAMERLRGEDLAQILRHQQRLPADEVVELVRQVGRGLEAAREAGIVHRDIKPQNLFRVDGEDRAWKILDFGVSKLVESGGTLTKGETVGTPNYMAPEQARGDKVDWRSDLYALGAIAYRALTGRAPFRGEELAVILVKVLGEMPMRPSAVAELHRDVDLALALALAKNPADRLESPEHLADVLETASAGLLERKHKGRARRLLAKMPWSELD
jgi:hypothetical protein